MKEWQAASASRYFPQTPHPSLLHQNLASRLFTKTSWPSGFHVSDIIISNEGPTSACKHAHANKTPTTSGHTASQCCTCHAKAEVKELKRTTLVRVPCCNFHKKSMSDVHFRAHSDVDFRVLMKEVQNAAPVMKSADAAPALSMPHKTMSESHKCCPQHEKLDRKKQVLDKRCNRCLRLLVLPHKSAYWMQKMLSWPHKEPRHEFQMLRLPRNPDSGCSVSSA